MNMIAAFDIVVFTVVNKLNAMLFFGVTDDTDTIAVHLLTVASVTQT